MTSQSQQRPAPAYYSYALLRILYGGVGCAFVLGLADMGKFWDPAGLVPLATAGWKATAVESGWGSVVGRVLFLVDLLAFLAMMLGYHARAAVAAAFVTSTLQAAWNPLPLSAAFQIMRAVLFCLIWSDSGRVWSLSARGSTDTGALATAPSMVPLQLICVQVALVYFATGLWKLGSEEWQDGTALYYVLATNGFSRLPEMPGLHLTSILTAMTHLVLMWELAFPLLVLVPWTRPLALGLGVVLHLGMWVTMDLGPFPWVMLASYVAFIPPARLETAIDACRRLVGRVPADGAVAAHS